MEVYTWIATGNQALGIQLNQICTGDDTFARELLREKKLRWALSYALNREEISELFHFGKGKPRQPGPIEQSPYFEHGRWYAHAALQYDLAKANRLLDELGLTRRGPQGFRIRPDGKPIALTLDYSLSYSSYEKSQHALLQLEVSRAPGDKGYSQARPGATAFCGVGHNLADRLRGRHAGAISPALIPTYRHINWANHSGLWYEINGRQGWRLPDDIARMHEIYDRIKACSDKQERYELMGRIFDLHAENLWCIGSLGGLPLLVLVHRRVGNVLRRVVSDWIFKTPGNAHPEQFYYQW